MNVGQADAPKSKRASRVGLRAPAGRRFNKNLLGLR